MCPSILFSLVSFIFATLSSADLSLSPYRVHESRTRAPAGWSITRRQDATSTIPLRFALKQRNIEAIGTFLYDVSHPRSPNYGKHWTTGDIARKFAPGDETIDTVRGWLIASGIGEDRVVLGNTGGWLRVDATIEEAEQLMNTEYNVYTHTSGKEHVACEVYHLPEHVQPHVDFVTPSVHFDAKLNRRSSSGGAASLHRIGQPGVGITPTTTDTVSEIIQDLERCDEYITPLCLRALYGLSYNPVATDKNSYGIVEYTPQAYLTSDLHLFAQNYSTDLIGKEPYVISIDGGYVQITNQSFSYNAESDLDLQYSMSLVTGAQTVTLYQTGDVPESASFNNFLDALDGSYCTFEGGDDPTADGIYPDPLPGGYTVKPAYCTEYAKLGLMGVTVLFSSGDHGVAGQGSLCLNPDGSQSTDGKVFNPTFPGTCPYVTSIGGTMMQSNTTVYEPEVACMRQIYSGGGFSNYFAMPDYQKDVVELYLKDSRPYYPSDIWNSTGTSRGFPDISANAANYVIALNGQFHRVYGTSASSPVCGAILTMINDARLAIGKGPIGFINPTVGLS
ncbi:tripeptidyl-peptidase I [Chiua virens]|nr:tripeptidyl-peptidase I [Chiua virens]